ncbi:MAG: proton-conducting transporter membrane subunit [bacterium]
MQTQEALIALLVLGPLVFGLLMLTGIKGILRNALVVVAGVVTIAAGVALPFFSGSMVPDVGLPVMITTLGNWIEPLVILIVMAIGVSIRSWPVRIMAAVQLGLCAVSFLMNHQEAVRETKLVVDALALIMVLIVSVIGSLIALYAIGYMNVHEHHAPATATSTNRFFFILISFLGLMNGLVLADDMKWLSIFWEGTTLCSFFLIGHDGTVEAKASARRAITLNVFGGLAMSLGVFLAAHTAGSESLSMVLTKGPVILLPLALLALATMTKSAQLPFQSWLLGAMVAPTPVSALLHSSTMVKAGSYLILRLAPALQGTALAPVIAIAGAFTFVVTSALAVGQSNGKKVLAYSTIANLGLIACCAGIGTPLAYAAGITILIFHAVSKALLFLCVGTIEQTIGSRDIEDMGGLLFKMPLTTNVAMIGMVSMMMPPFGMLVGKWMAIEASVSNPVVLILLILGSALTIFFWAKWLGRITTTSYHEKYKIETVSPWMLSVLIVIGLGVLAASVCATPIYAKLIKPISLATFGVEGCAGHISILDSVHSFLGWPMYVVFGTIALALLAGVLLFKPSQIRQPFLCGENMDLDDNSFTFRSIADGPTTALLTSYYLPLFEESKISGWGNPLAALIILSLFGVLFI